MRHTFGTLAVKRFPLTDVKTFMGHADINTTLIYVHHVPSDDASDDLTSVFSPGHDSLPQHACTCGVCGRRLDGRPTNRSRVA